MRRREFIATLTGAAVWPSLSRAQQKLPLIGFMDLGSFTKDAILRGLADNGFVRDRDFTDEDTWSALNVPTMTSQAAHLVQRGATLIFANGQTAFAAKAATRAIPIVFQTGVDPVATGLVASLNPPGGNVTGVSFLGTTLIAKRVELLHELVPAARTLAYFRNPDNLGGVSAETTEVEVAARTRGVKLIVRDVNAKDLWEDAFTAITDQGADGLIVGTDLVFWMARNYVADLAIRHRIPAIFSLRQYVEAGGLASFGVRFLDGSYAMGTYAARILKGDQPANLPVQQVTKTELALNLKTAKVLSLTVPPSLLARADEVIE